MKKNPLFAPLFYSKCNANKGKIARAKRILFLSIALMFSISAITTFSVGQPNDFKSYAKCTGISLGFIMAPFVAGTKGTKALNGHDETDIEFKARGDKAEADVAFTKRLMEHTVAEALKRAADDWKKDLGELKTKVEALKPNDTEGIEALKSEMRKQGLVIQGLKETKVVSERGIKEGSIAELLVKNKEKIQALVSNKSGLVSLEYKTHATDTSTDIANRNYYDSAWHEPGQVGQIAVRRPFLKQLFKNSNTTSEFLKYRDQNTVVRTAANVALCAASNTTSKLTWVTNTIQISKIRDYVDVCLDMMNDYSFVESEIRNLINTSVQLKVDDQLLNGTGTHPELNSLSSISSTWAANISGTKDWTSQVAKATLVDLIIVAQSQIQELGAMNKFMPNYVLLNPGDWASLMLIKNDFGDSIKYYPGLYVDNGGNIRINGMLVIPNPNITVNTLWIGDFTKGTVYSIPTVGIELSYENSTNFETETVTVKAYDRCNLLVRTVDTNAFMKITDITVATAAITH